MIYRHTRPVEALRNPSISGGATCQPGKISPREILGVRSPREMGVSHVILGARALRATAAALPGMSIRDMTRRDEIDICDPFALDRRPHAIGTGSLSYVASKLNVQLSRLEDKFWVLPGGLPSTGAEGAACVRVSDFFRSSCFGFVFAGG